ncbi:MAG: hypothetical protein OCD01_20250 [Fibrobacterales bacterium]
MAIFFSVLIIISAIGTTNKGLTRDGITYSVTPKCGDPLGSVYGGLIKAILE